MPSPRSNPDPTKEPAATDVPSGAALIAIGEGALGPLDVLACTHAGVGAAPIATAAAPPSTMAVTSARARFDRERGEMEGSFAFPR